jgi:hypothetical protein
MSQPKFRIVKRIGANDLFVCDDEAVYVAQRKVLDLFWVNCRLIDPENSLHTFDKNIKVVERYIQRKLHKHQPPQDEVVKTFYEE